MGEAAHYHQVGAGATGILAQSFGHIAISCADRFGFDLDTVGKKMRGQGRPREDARQILFSFNLDNLDRLRDTRISGQLINIAADRGRPGHRRDDTRAPRRDDRRDDRRDNRRDDRRDDRQKRYDDRPKRSDDTRGGDDRPARKPRHKNS